MLAMLAVAAAGCNNAQIASSNLSRAADNFEIMRRVVLLNGITDTYLLSIEGLCSVEDQGSRPTAPSLRPGFPKRHNPCARNPARRHL